MKVSVGHYTFDNVSYDAEADVLYLHMGDPSTAADFDESPEGHALRFDVEQNLVGVTIVGVKRLLERDGKVTITVPKVVRVDAEVIAPALVTA
ncbi:MAG: DUF2283 domain-containing protein [Solirubrobacteraceae bacterium]